MPDTKNKFSPEALNAYLLRGMDNSLIYTRAYFYWKKFRAIHRIFQDELRLKSGPIKVIDIGCSCGSTVFSLDHGFGRGDLEFFGIDLNPTEIYCCNLRKQKHQTGNFTFTVMNAESLDYPDNSFDILLSIEVLEHLQSPERAVNEFYRVLKPGGFAIITTPNRSTLVSKSRKILRSILGTRYPDRKETEDLDFDKTHHTNEEEGYGHISVKGLKEWIGILSGSGFKIEKIGRGSLLYGSQQMDKNRAIMALALIAEIFLDRLPLFKNLSEDVILSARKPASLHSAFSGAQTTN